jgi:hypothetical protein
MALILEIRDRRGVATWHPLRALPLTIGRGLANDIILDDPYIDGSHARVVATESGALVLEDLGSVNGLRSNGTRLIGNVALTAGTEIRIGHTTLRFRDADEPVAPALMEAPRVPGVTNWLMGTGKGTLVLVAALIALSVLVGWIGSSERNVGSTLLMLAVGMLATIGIWAGIWSVAARGPDRRYHLAGHVAVITAAALLVQLYAMLADWVTFFFPEAEWVAVISVGVGLFALVAVIVGHLSVAGALTPRGRWRVGGGIALAMLLLVIIAGAINEDDFSSVPKFPSSLKPIMPALVPTHSIGDFVSALDDARKSADVAIEK